MEILRSIWSVLFCWKKIDGKKWIEDSMTEKYGPDWLDQCIEGLKDPEVRKSLADDLKLEQTNKKI